MINPLKLSDYDNLEDLCKDMYRQKLITGSIQVEMDELDKHDFIDPVYGKCNIMKALRDRRKAMENEYEAFDLMHRADGTFTKCPPKL